MGIDIYMWWEGQTPTERKRQAMSGFSIVDGNFGYLHEAYHGSPYATRELVPEAFAHTQTYECSCEPYDIDTDSDTIGSLLESYYEREQCDGCKGAPIKAVTLEERLPGVIETVIKRARSVYNEHLTETSPAVESFTQFVELARRKEEETGQPVRIFASY